jgi:hypothetical protein
MAAGDLTTLDNLKEWLGLTGAQDDALLARMITAYSQYIKTFLAREVLSANYVEVRDGKPTGIMSFANYPVTAVASVTINGQSIPASPDNATMQFGYGFDAEQIWLVGYGFSPWCCYGVGRSRRNVRLAYTAGFATVPADIEQALIETIGLRYREKDRIGYQSKSLAGETISFTMKDFSASAQTVLNSYRRVITL